MKSLIFRHRNLRHLVKLLKHVFQDYETIFTKAEDSWSKRLSLCFRPKRMYFANGASEVVLFILFSTKKPWMPTKNGLIKMNSESGINSFKGSRLLRLKKKKGFSRVV